jgi:2-polyprenyl-6-methoxyphenol hydroxylase-like FAD-dependent oxidoreductase
MVDTYLISGHHVHGAFSLMNIEDQVLIVGCGCFGLSTAYHLLKRGCKYVTLIDRSETLPAPDAASQDLNKGMCMAVRSVFFLRSGRQSFVPLTTMSFTLNWHGRPLRCGRTRKNGGILITSAP